MIRIAVTGHLGQVATALRHHARAKNLELVFLARPEFDMSRPQSIAPAIDAAAPDIIVSAAAYTAVDRAESEPDLALAVNGTAPGIIGETANRRGVPVIHLSTDYVFSGDKLSPYGEDDPTGPQTVYGQTKLAGEQALAAATSDCTVLRTAWVYSPFGSNFLKTMLRLGAELEVIRVVADQRGNPTSAPDIADAVISVAGAMLDQPQNGALRGVFHLAGTGDASWAEFAAAIYETSGELGGVRATVVPIASAEYPTPAPRPMNSRLLTDKLATAFGVRLPDWRQSMRETVRVLLT